ncbi:MAG TPA: hypothetical protein VFA81_11795 [Burkholderiales bacterium]|nr:hypothetical protein [Burkholderiales bacterium]
MKRRLVALLLEELPRLAWVAEIDRHADVVVLRHGQGVEVHGNFAVEGIWDGPFTEGAFSNRGHFFGSGLRIEGQRVTFSASSALVDRLVYAVAHDQVLCSNSLPLLLGRTRARLDDCHDYTAECHALMAGKRRYPKAFHVVASDFEFGQVYGENLSVTADAIEHVGRDAATALLRTFAEYERALHERLEALFRNIRDPARNHPVQVVSTVSTGYDSVAVAVLGRQYGVRECFTTSGDTDPALENGVDVANALGLRPSVMHRAAPDPLAELFLLAATLDGREAIFASMVEQLCSTGEVTAVLTGYHGDKMWSRDASGDYLSPDIMRGDTSGLNLAEARLLGGFINVPIPFLFASQIKDVVAISNSQEMAPWQLGNDYDRPLPRRLAETAGLDRNRFGQKKSVVMDYDLLPRNKTVRKELFRYLTDRFGYGAMSHIAHELVRALDYRLAVVPFTKPSSSLQRHVWPGERQLANRIFVWSVNRVADRMAEWLRRAEPERTSDSEAAASTRPRSRRAHPGRASSTANEAR